MKQTAVEWLQDNLKDFFQIDFAHLDYMTRAFEQAKAMEKEQIRYAWKIGYNKGYYDPDCENDD
jgi:hypothetical protein